ncbi:hypothetical protein DIPPA_10343 [Diplonema papillatum]|nr:hypothetical protein DIPPA_10343 [Diplonema papillatum]
MIVQCNVRTLEGNDVAIEVEPHCQVAELKKSIAEATGYCFDTLRVVWQGRMLRDDMQELLQLSDFSPEKRMLFGLLSLTLATDPST